MRILSDQHCKFVLLILTFLITLISSDFCLEATPSMSHSSFFQRFAEKTTEELLQSMGSDTSWLGEQALVCFLGGTCGCETIDNPPVLHSFGCTGPCPAPPPGSIQTTPCQSALRSRDFIFNRQVPPGLKEYRCADLALREAIIRNYASEKNRVLTQCPTLLDQCTRFEECPLQG